MHKHQGAEHPEKLQTLQFTQKKSCTQVKVLNDRGHILNGTKVAQKTCIRAMAREEILEGPPPSSPGVVGGLAKTQRQKRKSKEFIFMFAQEKNHVGLQLNMLYKIETHSCGCLHQLL